MIGRAFDSALVPILGFFLLPWTTLAYVLLYDSGRQVTGFEWFIVGLGFLFDLSSARRPPDAAVSGRGDADCRVRRPSADEVDDRRGAATRRALRGVGCPGRRGQREGRRRDLEVVGERAVRDPRAGERARHRAEGARAQPRHGCWTCSIASYFQRCASENAA